MFGVMGRGGGECKIRWDAGGGIGSFAYGGRRKSCGIAILIHRIVVNDGVD